MHTQSKDHSNRNNNSYKNISIQKPYKLLLAGSVTLENIQLGAESLPASRLEFN